MRTTSREQARPRPEGAAGSQCARCAGRARCARFERRRISRRATAHQTRRPPPTIRRRQERVVPHVNRRIAPRLLPALPRTAPNCHPCATRYRRHQLDSHPARGLESGTHTLATWHADVAQLVEHHLAKVGVAGSSPVVRSTARPSGTFGSGYNHRWVGREARQRPAKPYTRVRIPYPPRGRLAQR